MISTSRNDAVISMTPNLNCDTTIRPEIVASDTAAESAGPRSTISRTKFSSPQISSARISAK